MITLPSYNLIVSPGMLYYYQNTFYETLTGVKPHRGDKVAIAIQKSAKKPEELTEEDFYPIGAIGQITEVDRNGNVGVSVTERIDLTEISFVRGHVRVEAVRRQDTDVLTQEEESEFFRRVKNKLFSYAQTMDSQTSVMFQTFLFQWNNIWEMLAAMSNYLQVSSEEKYKVLESDSPRERLAQVEKILFQTLEIYRVGNDAESKQNETQEKAYREDAIKRQIEILQKELDEMHPENVSDIRKFEQKIASVGMNETARAEAEKVLNRMKQEGKDSHEYGLLYDYLDFVTSLSWKKEPMGPVDLKHAEEILDEDHFGLEKVKKRIIEQLAVMALNQTQSGSILLFVGPPGTGKTSIGQSIARALGRSYARISLGGVRDEAEIRGHRRTYIGAMPGRIMEGIKRSGASNPVIVLDEVDKLAKDYGGDPSSALLEVLDPEQNHSFTDHYMNVPYDLSDVLFVCTANTVDTIPEPLFNRMEMIPFPGYTAEEKYQIARRHLLPRSMKTMGISKQQLKVTDEAIRTIIADYTMESGVRGLKKNLDTLCRAAAVRLVKGEQKSLTVNERRLKDFLNQKPIRHDSVLEEKKPGVVTGLAWTQAGGDILYIETMFTKGKGNVMITGQLGDIMKESVQIAISLVKEMAPEKVKLFEENDLHVHVPAGAVPKDGPSAGITLTTALMSLVCDQPVSPEIAMTGEVSLRGFVMPIGGLPEKLMAAQRAGIRKVFIPRENVDDLDEVAEEVKQKLEIIPVHRVKEVLKKTGLPV